MKQLVESKMFRSTFMIKLNGFEFKFVGLASEKGIGVFALLHTLPLITFVLHDGRPFGYHI